VRGRLQRRPRYLFLETAIHE
jgi:signal recognition particle subunit SRP54